MKNLKLEDIIPGTFITIHKSVYQEHDHMEDYGKVLKVLSTTYDGDDPIHAVPIRGETEMDLWSIDEIDKHFTKESNPEYFL